MSKWLIVALVSTSWIYFIHSQLTCKENEISIECAHCGPKRCEDLGHPIPCGGATSLCNPECVCMYGYVWNSNRTCIPKTECPSCGGDVNATAGCGNHCGNSCSDYKEVNKTCLSGCRYNGCQCKIGYVFHEGLSKCISPEDC